MDKRWNFSLWYFLLGFLVLSIAHDLLVYKPRVELAYSEFKQAAAVAELKELRIGGERIEGLIKRAYLQRLKPELSGDSAEEWQGFSTLRVADPELVQLLDVAKIPYAGVAESTFLSTLLSWLLPFLAMLFVWQLALGRMGGGAGMLAIGKSKARVYVDKDIKARFADVAGKAEAVDELKEVVSFLTAPERYTALSGRLPKGILLVGAPGTGKTRLARAEAGSEETARAVDREVMGLLREAYGRVEALLRRHEAALHALAALLEQKESVDGQTARELVERHREAA